MTLIVFAKFQWIFFFGEVCCLALEEFYGKLP